MTLHKHLIDPGQWVLLFLFLSFFLSTSLFAQSETGITGDWHGKLSLPNGTLRIVFHIHADKEGGLTSTVDSPDQHAAGIPVGNTSFEGGKLILEIAAIQGKYEGVLDEGSQTLKGAWSQGGASLPLDMVRGGASEKPVRPQEPERPFPYNEEDVAFEGGEAGVKLAGTLTIPRTAGPHPGVVLISGSGPQDRDEALMGHRPFFVLADHLTRSGIIVLRYDDRGTAKSTGNFSAATTRDLADDAQAAIHYLKTRKEIAVDKIGLIGHSEGGLIAPMLAAETEDVAFIVMLAGPGLPGHKILNMQGELIARASGMSEDMIKDVLFVNNTLYETAANTQEHALDARLKTTLTSLRETLGDDKATAIGLTDDRDASLIQQLSSPWFRFFLSYDPQPALQNVKAPVLSLIGAKDLQVPAEENTAAIKSALEAGGNGSSTTLILPDLNHLFQHATTGAPAEYGLIEETFAEEALDLISKWIVEQTNEAK